MRTGRRPRHLTALAAAAVVGALVVPGASAAEPHGASTATGPAAAANAGRGHLHTHGPDGLELDRGRSRDAAGPRVAAQPVDNALTGAWSTTEPLPVKTSDDPDRFGGLPSVHLVYLYPSDMKSPRTQFLNMFEADAKAAKSFLEAKYMRSVRFDERTGGRIDITTVKSAYRTRQLGGSTQFDLVKKDLSRVFPDSESPRKKYIAWLDAPSRYCGQGELYGDWHRDRENWNDLRTTGVVYRPYSETNADGGFCRGRTLLHELGHNLGALYKYAPHAFDGAHCNDDKNDAMCYQGDSAFDSTSTGSTGEFDWGNDDYWDAGAVPSSVNSGPETGTSTDAHLKHLNWWTVNLSRFVCRPKVVDGKVVAPTCTGTVDTVQTPDADSIFPTLDEFRYHSGDEAYPPPASQPTT